MTCVIGYLDLKHNCSWIGGDSLGSGYMNKATNENEKVFK